MSSRKLDLKTFLDGVSGRSQELISEYFDRKALEHGKEALVSDFTTDNVIRYLDSDEDAKIKDDIRQDFIQINDLCGRSMWFLVDEINRRGIPKDENEGQEELGMRIFLKHKDVFEYAHDRYYFTHSSGKISAHNIAYDRGSILADDQKQLFDKKVREYFANSAKGSNCKIRYHKKNDRLMIAVERGSYKRAVSTWDGDEMRDTRTILYRPAKEDFLDYVFSEQKLYIKASSDKDRELYIAVFSEHIVNDRDEASRDDRDETFNLGILQDPDFRFDLDETIQAVYLLEVGVAVVGMRNPIWTLRSADVLSSLRDDVRGLGLNRGTIKHARFLFRLNIGGKNKKVTFEITPPNSTDLNKKKYATIITRYLERIGIKKSAQTPATALVESATALV